MQQQKAKASTPAGLEPTRDKPNRFLVDRLNRSATVSLGYDAAPTLKL